MELPYVGEQISMYAMLPDAGSTTTNSILNNLNKNTLDQAISRLVKTPIDVAFPKFKMDSEFSTDLKEVCI